MIEEVISKLDTKGLMVLTVLIGKRCMEILNDPKVKDNKDTTGTKVTTDTKDTLVLPVSKIIV